MSRAATAHRWLEPGTRLGDRYRITTLLGAGSFGATYRAVDEQLFERVVAVKVLTEKATPTATRLFEREARVLSALSHPAIPRVHEYLTADGTLALVQELVEGRTLATMLREDGPLSEPEVVSILGTVLDVLAFLHARTPPVVHRDVKPDNLIVGLDGSVHLIDFGAVREAVAGAELTGDRTVIGPGGGFAPPELDRGHAQPVSDVYCAAATALTLLTGRLPARFFDPVSGQLRPLASVLPDASPSLVALLESMLADRPSDRPSAASAADALRGDVSVHPSPPSRTVPVAPHAAPAPFVELDATQAATVLGAAADPPAVAASVPRAHFRRPLVVGAVVATVLAAGAGAVHQLKRADGGVSVRPACRSGDTLTTDRRIVADAGGGHRTSMLVPHGWAVDSIGGRVLAACVPGTALRVWTGHVAAATAAAALDAAESRFRPLLDSTQRMSADPARRDTVPDTSALQRFYRLDGPTGAVRASAYAALDGTGTARWWFASYGSPVEARKAADVIGTLTVVPPATP
jgi:hypothetical protein